MAMRRGHHTSRVLKALGTPNGEQSPDTTFTGKPKSDIIPSEFDDQ
jgi:acetolactate synthase-1/3 small subunit